MAEICQHLGIQGIAGEILAGILIGPSLLGWVHPIPILETFSELAVMLLLFRVGLDVSPSDLLKVSGQALVVAAAGVVLPFFLSWAVLTAYGASSIEAIFVGAAMVATSVGITAHVLAARGVLDHRASQIILAAAVIDDLLGLLVLAAVASLASGTIDYWRIALTCLLASAFVLLVALYGTKLMSGAAPRLKKNLKLQESEFSIAMVLLFALSLLAVYAGVAAIIGAFLAGLVLSGTAGPRLRDLSSGAMELMLPFFLVGIGLHVDLAVFKQPAIVRLAIVLLIAAILSKLIGCGLGAFPLGRKDMLRIGVGMIPRGEVGMVVAKLGLGIGMVSLPIYGVVVAVCVATTVLAPPLLAIVFKDVPPSPNASEHFQSISNIH